MNLLSKFSSLSSALAAAFVASAFVLAVQTASAIGGSGIILDNGVIRMEINQAYSDTAGMTAQNQPIINKLSVLGTQFLPHDNAGADLQMTLRDLTGDNWNPTQGGTCWPDDQTSTLIGAALNWGEAGWPQTGASLAISPLDFGWKNGNTCSPTPLNNQVRFQFTVSPGNGVAKPKEVVSIGMNWLNTSGHTIDKGGSELPIGYFRDDTARYAYFRSSTGVWRAANTTVANGGCATAVPNNDVRSWPLGSACTVQNIRCIALANTSTWLTSGGVAVAFCSKFNRTHAGFWHVGSNPKFNGGGVYNLASMGLTADGELTDTNWHAVKIMLGVGNKGTIENNYNWAITGGMDFTGTE